MKRSIRIGACVLLLSGIGMLWLLWPTAEDTAANRDIAQAVAIPTKGVQVSKSETAALREGKNSFYQFLTSSPLPKSLFGTDVDGELLVDADGNFIPSQSALRLFDYFLLTTGEEALPVITARILEQIENRLDEPARGQAIEFLEDYFKYRESARTLAQQGYEARDLEEAFATLRSLQVAAFGQETADALFVEDHELALVSLEKYELLGDEDLSQEEIDQEFADLESSLPQHVQERREAVMAPLRTSQQVNQLRETGASEAEIQELREAQFGARAAKRLEALDQKRADWNQRLDTYRELRNEILDDSTVTPLEAESELNALRAEFFSKSETPRIKALDEADFQVAYEDENWE